MRNLLWLSIFVLAGCAAQAAPSEPSIDVNALVKAHPLYGTLAQYDRQIAVLRATLHVPEFARKSEAFAHAQAAAASQLDAAAARSRAIAAMPSPDVRTLLAQQHVDAPSEADVRSTMQRAYAAQAAQLRTSAQQDMARFQASLQAQQDAAFANYVRAVHARVQQAYASRRQQLYEKESALALDLAKADVGKRLTIRTQLQTLTLGSDHRRALQAQLDAIQRREDAALAQQRRRDEAVLAAFLPPLQARADSDIAKMRANLQTRTAANLAERRRVLAAQTARQMNLQFGTQARTTAPGDMGTRLDALLHTQGAVPNAFLAARTELNGSFSAVKRTDDAATQTTWAQIAHLETARAQLYSDIVTQIRRDAERVARLHPNADVMQGVKADFDKLQR